MCEWIASRIKDAKNRDGVESAREKYKLYFLITDKMKKYKEETDSILQAAGYEDCIAESCE